MASDKKRNEKAKAMPANLVSHAWEQDDLTDPRATRSEMASVPQDEDALDEGFHADDEQEWAPKPPPPTPSWDSLEAHVTALQDAIGQSDWGRTAELGQTLSHELKRHRDDPFLSSEPLPGVASDGRYAPFEKGLPDVPSFDEFGLCRASERRFRPLIQFLAERYFRVEVEGLSHVPSEGRVILVANHAGMLPYDAMILRYVVGEQHHEKRSVRPLIEDMFYHAPVVGPWLYRMGCVRASRQNAVRLLAQEEVIAVFPEGAKGIQKPFTQRYQLQRFGRGGFIKLALQTGAPIVPVAIVGAEETHPLLGQLSRWTRPFGLPFFPITPTFPWLGAFGLVPFPSKWRIRFGAPIWLPTEGTNEESMPLFVNQWKEEVRGTLQSMVTQLVS